MELRTNIIINDETIKTLKGFPSNSVDLIFVDPPYWMRVSGTLHRTDGSEFNGCYDEWDQFESFEEYKKFTYDWLYECKRILKDNGSIWVIGGMQCIYMIGGIMQELGYWFINDVIWQKSNPTPNFKGTRLNNSHETLIWATKSEKSKYTFNYKTAKELNLYSVSEEDFRKGIRKQLGSIWKIPVVSGNERLKDDNNNKLHSTQKPEKLLYNIIAISSKIGDVVLDPFAGTMTTGAMAKKLSRKYIMVEGDSRYCEYGKRRLENIKEILDDISKATFDVKPKKVTVKDMIEANYINLGDKLYIKETDNFAILVEHNKIEHNNNIYGLHDGVAYVADMKNKNRLNGFDYWTVNRNGKRVYLKELREKLRKE